MQKNKHEILIVDDDIAVTTSLALLLKQFGFISQTAHSPVEAMQKLEKSSFSLVLQDMNFSRRTTGEEGLELLKSIKEKYKTIPVILITAWGSVSLAVEGMKLGAADFITKPWSNDHILSSITTILKVNGLEKTSKYLKREDLDAEYDFSGLIGKDKKFLEVLDVIGRIAATDAPVLITGESGTGKELIADAIWRNSQRNNKPFIKVNLAGIPTTLFESEMFGHVKGAFTDAKHSRTGRFANADKGSIFLDEIGDLDPGSQVKLLRVLQNRTFESVGSSKTQKIDARVISATNRNLNKMIEDEEFREDLFYRINLITVALPALRERQTDIPVLAEYFLKMVAENYSRSGLTISDQALTWMQSFHWPGNIRQLKQVIERTVLLTRSNTISVDDISRALEMQPVEKGKSGLPDPGSLTLDEIEKEYIIKTLEKYNGHITRASEALGISRSALYRRLEKYGITV